MKLAGEYVFDAGVQDVWDALFDPQVLAAVMPGCEKLELDENGAFLGELKVKVGPIQGKFSGKVDLSDKVEPKSYKMVVDGRGAQGFVKATATIELVPEGGKTKVVYDSDAQVGGKIASVGQRLVETSAKAIVKQSLEGLAENIKIRTEAYKGQDAAAPVAAAPVATPAPKPVAGNAIDAIDAIDGPTAVADTVNLGPVVTQKREASATIDTSAIEAKLGSIESQLALVVTKLTALEKKANAPVIQYKQADAGKMASAVAKDVAKSMAPIISIVVVVLALVIYFVWIH
ncbi:MAG TPA: carbon monoxide dehydrogenase subunit G [Kofleriaceae bacterium]